MLLTIFNRHVAHVRLVNRHVAYVLQDCLKVILHCRSIFDSLLGRWIGIAARVGIGFDVDVDHRLGVDFGPALWPSLGVGLVSSLVHP
jgi:hypothetical protein